MPTDADVILITNGHHDHIESAPDLIRASTKQNAKIVSNGEVNSFLDSKRPTAS